MTSTCISNRNTGLYDREIPRYIYLRRHLNASQMPFTAPKYRYPIRLKLKICPKQRFSQASYYRFDIRPSIIAPSSSPCQNESNTIFFYIVRSTMKLDRNLTQAQGHEMTQTYHVAYHMMRLAKSNSMVPVKGLYLYCIKRYRY